MEFYLKEKSKHDNPVFLLQCCFLCKITALKVNHVHFEWVLSTVDCMFAALHVIASPVKVQL